jgi:hypothetical protein
LTVKLGRRIGQKPLVVIVCSALAGVGGLIGAITMSTPPHAAASSQNVTAPVTSSSPPSGVFSHEPALSTPMSIADAIAEARSRGAAMGSSSASTAAVTASVVTYSAYAAKLGFAKASQLGATNLVICVHVHAAITPQSVSHPAGVSAPPAARSYSVAYDPRTGLPLGFSTSPNP